MSVIHIWIVVFGDHHSVGELAAGECLHGFLTVGSRYILHKDLKLKTKNRCDDQSRTSEDDQWVFISDFTEMSVLMFCLLPTIVCLPDFNTCSHYSSSRIDLCSYKLREIQCESGINYLNIGQDLMRSHIQRFSKDQTGRFKVYEIIIRWLSSSGWVWAPYSHLSTAGDFHTIDGPGDLDGADATILAALLADVLQDLLIVLVIHQLLGHHHVEKTQHLRGHARVLQPLEPRDLQRHRGLYDGGLRAEEEVNTMTY